ncbi:hypothetical protein PGT21_021891 [Puccinia graminis f. sp. tritici]|uniref:Uncharacterized protein n=1 Tax=Puccinia graminis f. sp. tritici TaxID=56615 RepID=A0A5B0M0R9_PUCGR|nr:hypothetical protein PGT21_021891 [Puccinia graminis f. sp. tritici]
MFPSISPDKAAEIVPSVEETNEDEFSQLDSKRRKLDPGVSVGSPVSGQSGWPSQRCHLSDSNRLTNAHVREVGHVLGKDSASQNAVIDKNLSGRKSDPAIGSHSGNVNKINIASKSLKVEEQDSQFLVIRDVVFDTSTQDRSRDTNSESQPEKDELLPTRKVRQVIVDSKFWAWISITWSLLEHELSDQMKRHVESRHGKLIHHLPLDTALGADEEQTIEGFKYDLHLRKRLADLIVFLWAVNHQVLSILGTSVADPRYLKEQRTLRNWFMRFIKRCKGRYSLAKTEKNAYHQDESEKCLEEREIYQKITETIYSTSDMNAYRVYQEGLTIKPIFIPKPKIIRNETAVQVLGYYYKIINKRKWLYVFGDYENFIVQVASFGKKAKESKPLELKSNDSTQEHSVLIPWKSSCSPGLLNSIKHKFNHEPMANFEDYVKPIFQGITPNIFTHQEVFEPKNTNEGAWAWISRIQLHKINRFDKLFQPVSDSIITKIRSCLCIYLKNHSSQDTQQIQGKSDGECLRLFSKVFDLLWNLNRQVLESFACEPNEEEYINEQKSVQLFFLSCIFERQGELAKIKREQGGEMTGIASKSQNEAVLKLIVNLLISDNRKKRFMIPHSSSDACGKTILLQEDLDISRLAVMILGCYYKNQNIEKWSFLFKADERFLIYLLNKSTELFHRDSLKAKKSKSFGSFKTYQIVPWKTQMKPELKLLNLELGHRNIADFKSWVIPYQEKDTNS